MEINVNDKLIKLKVSMWIVDENRLFNMQNEKPGGLIWSLVSMIYLAHLNHQRRIKQDPQISTEELEIFIDDKYNTPEGQKEISEITGAIKAEVDKIVGVEDTKQPAITDNATPDDEKKS